MKKVKESVVEMTEIVMPQDVNTVGTIFGGKIMQWMDIAAAICGFRHCRKPVVTASVDTLHFLKPIKVGDIVTIKASVNYVGKTSMEIGVKVEAEEPLTGIKKHSSSAYFTFVATNDEGKPIPVSPVQPETLEEKRRYKEGEERRQFRLKRRTKKNAS